MNTKTTRTVLTRRGRIVRDVAVITVILLAAWWLNDATTPDMCRVAVEDMSSACKSLLFP